MKAHFEGSGLIEPPVVIGLSAARAPSVFDKGPNLRDWLAENSGGVARLGQVRYIGCLVGMVHAAAGEAGKLVLGQRRVRRDVAGRARRRRP